MSLNFDKDGWILRAVSHGAYKVLRDGRVFRRKAVAGTLRKPAHAIWTQQVMSTHERTGRVYFNMRFEEITKSVLLNRVVALVHIPNPLDLPEVNHRFGNLQHNAADDLEWASRGEQERHAFAHGLKANRGSSNANAKLVASQVLEIRASSATPLEIARAFDVSVSTVQSIKANKTWQHL